MSEFYKQLALIYEETRRTKIRHICIVACVVIVFGSALGAMFYCLPGPVSGIVCEPATYTHTDVVGTTITTTTNGRQTITTVTNADGQVISMSINGGSRTQRDKLKKPKKPKR